MAGNPTQYIMEKAFARAGLDWRYLTLEVPPSSLGDAIRGIRALGFRGANLTIPHKVAVTELLDDLSQPARLIGAVNCIHRRGDQLIGENTDGKGFLGSLREVIDPKEKQILVIGAGGAARAIAVELGLAGAARIAIVNRTEERGAALARHIETELEVPSEFRPLDRPLHVPEETDIVINATSIGLGDPRARVPVDPKTLRKDLIVADVVFNPVETSFLQEARLRGCTTLDGLGMLVRQAAIAFRIWTNVDADETVMREALEEFLGL